MQFPLCRVVSLALKQCFMVGSMAFVDALMVV